MRLAGLLSWSNDAALDSRGAGDAVRVTFYLWGEETFSAARAIFAAKGQMPTLVWSSEPRPRLLGWCRRNQHTPAVWQLPPRLLTWYEHRILELENEWN